MSETQQTELWWELMESLDTGITYDQYAEIDAINFHRLKSIDVSELHLRAALEGRLPDEDTDSKKFGRIVHAMILEPDTVDRDWMMAGQCHAAKLKSKGPIGLGAACPSCGVVLEQLPLSNMVSHCKCRRTLYSGNDKCWYQRCMNEGSRFWNGQWFCGTKGHAPMGAVQMHNAVSQDAYARAKAVTAAVHAHDVSGVIDMPGWSEVPLTWEMSGVQCKCRLDRVAKSYAMMDGTKINQPIIVDIKKVPAGNITDEAVIRTIERWGYHQQMGYYRAGFRYATGVQPLVWLLFVEEAYPFDVNLLPLDDETLLIGELQVKDMLTRYKRARAVGTWKGVFHNLGVREVLSGKIRPGGLSAHYRKRMQHELESFVPSQHNESLRGL